MTLSAVPEKPDGSLPANIPYFEGKQVHETKLVIKGLGQLECDDRVLKTDAVCRLVIEARTSSVNHQVDEKTGKLVRIQTVRAIDVEFAPWEAGKDNGVIQ